MNVLLIAGAAAAAQPAVDALRRAGGVGEVELLVVPDPAGRAELDPALDRLAGRRLVVAGSPATLGDVLTRLLRRDELSTTPVGVIDPAGPANSPWSRGAPGGGTADGPDGRLVERARIAVVGVPVPVDLVRDDHGGVLVDRAELVPWQGRRLGARAYVDGTPIADGEVTALTVMPAGGGRLSGRAGPPRRWRSTSERAAEGRAVQISCAEARLTVDGRAHPRPVTRRNWWVEPGRWLVLRDGWAARIT